MHVQSCPWCCSTIAPLPHLLHPSLSEQRAHSRLRHVAVEILLLYSHMRTERRSEMMLSEEKSESAWNDRLCGGSPAPLWPTDELKKQGERIDVCPFFNEANKEGG